MSKLVAAIVTTAGVSTVSAGGYFLVKGNGAGQDKSNESVPSTVVDNTASNTPVQSEPKDIPTPIDPAELKFTNLSDFSNETAGACAKKYFGDLDFSSESLKQEGEGGGSAPKPDSTKSCFVVNWDRGGEKDNTWTGSFKWLWALERESDGVVMFAVAKPSEQDSKKLNLEGRMYLVRKQEEKWVFAGKKDSTGKTIDASNFGSVFVQSAQGLDGLDSGASNPYYWGFAEGASEMNNLCKSGETGCPTSLDKRFRGSWSWAPDASKNNTLYSWSSSLQAHLDHMYPVVTSSDPAVKTDRLDLDKSFKNYKGTWNKDKPQ